MKKENTPTIQHNQTLITAIIFKANKVDTQTKNQGHSVIHITEIETLFLVRCFTQQWPKSLIVLDAPAHLRH